MVLVRAEHFQWLVTSREVKCHSCWNTSLNWAFCACYVLLGAFFFCVALKKSFSLFKYLLLFLFGGRSETNLIFNGFSFGNDSATWRDVLWLALKIKALLLLYLEHFNTACDLSLFIKRKRGKKNLQKWCFSSVAKISFYPNEMKTQN